MTEAHRIKSAPDEFQDSFRLSFDRASMGKVMIGLDGMVAHMNQAMHRLLGHQGIPPRAVTLADVIHPDDLPAEQALMARLTTGESTNYLLENRYLTAAGPPVTRLKSVYLVRGDDGSPLHFVAEILDTDYRKEQEMALSRERSRLQEAQLIGRLGSWEVDLATGEITWSDALFVLRGLDRKDFTGDWSRAFQLVHPEDRGIIRAALDACASTGEPILVRYRITRANDGALRWVEARGRATMENGRPVAMTGTVVDVTEDVLANEEVTAAHAFQQAVFSASPDIIFVYDLGTAATVWANRSLADILGYQARSPAESSDGFLEALIAQDDRVQYDDALVAIRDAGDEQVVQVNYRLRAADGLLRWFSRRTTPLHRDEQGKVTQFFGVMRDITDAIAVEQRLQFSALHDSLTGLPNRELLIDRMQGALARSGRDQREISVLFCDLDGFKRVNDIGGHAAGDAVLLETARRLQGVLREGDTVARVGGDEFVVVLEPWNRPATPEHAISAESDRELGPQIAERISAVLREPIQFNGLEHVVTASIGITYGVLMFAGRPRAITAEEILQDADSAMYRAKGRGKDRFDVFEHDMRVEVVERGRVENILRLALRAVRNASPNDGSTSAPHEETAIKAAYQPVFESETGRLVGFEALARLTDAGGMEIPPDVFISIAENTGLIRPIGVLMLEHACGQLARWRKTTPGLERVTMAVNVSAAQAGNVSLGNDVRCALSAHGLAPSDLILELTETALLRAAHATITSLHSLHAEGVGIAIDDFGVGYASLRYLATLPVSAVKIDRSFTAGLPGDETSRKIVSAVAGLAADMGLDCIVEGVESDAQLRALPSGVQLQGYLTGRPQLPQELDLARLVAFGSSAVGRLPHR